MLEIVKAKVLSVTSNDFLDAYLLSESSMFVYPYRIVLKTCGTTTLLNALPRVLEIARDYCGLSVVDSFFYSRKAFMFPERQIFPHGKWSNEVEFLDAIFPATDFETSPYVVGKINSDHWCLYLANTTAVLEQDGVVLGEVEVEDDVTLEVMMYGLDKKTMKRFWKDYYSGDCGYSSGSDAMVNRVEQKYEFTHLYPSSLAVSPLEGYSYRRALSWITG